MSGSKVEKLLRLACESPSEHEASAAALAAARLMRASGLVPRSPDGSVFGAVHWRAMADDARRIDALERKLSELQLRCAGWRAEALRLRVPAWHRAARAIQFLGIGMGLCSVVYALTGALERPELARCAAESAAESAAEPGAEVAP